MLVSSGSQKNPEANQVTYSGHLDQVSGRLIEGWACCQLSLGNELEVVSVDIYDYNRLLGTVRADKFRPDLLEVGIGAGEHAFFYKLPIEIFDGAEHVISARISGTDFILPGSPRILKRPPLSLAEAFDGPPKSLLHERPLSDFQFVVLKSLAMLMETVSIQSRNLEAQSEALKLLLNKQHTPDSSSVESSDHTVRVDYGPLFDEASAYLGESGDIIFFSIIDWNFRIQRPQHLAKQFSRLGYRVIYISVQFDDINISIAPFKVIASPATGIFEVRLACSSPLPNIYNGIEVKAQLRELCQSLDSLIYKLNVKGPIAFVQFPSWLPLALSLSGGLLVHDCLDHIAGFNNVSGYVVDQEHMLIEQADIVVTTSAYLHDFVGKKRANEIIRNAAEVEYFSKMPAKLAINKSKPIIGYFGAISEWFDTQLVEFCAVKNPDLDFALIGRVDDNLNLGGLLSLPNVKFYGEQPYEVLTEYLYAFDVCIIPFKVVELIQATNPVKVYEYLSSGKPVVSTDMPEVRAISDYVYIAKTDLEFDLCIKAALDEKDEAIPSARVNWVQQQSWETRALDYVSVFKKTSPKVSIIILCYNNLEFTKICLDSIFKFTNYDNCEIVCVNNGSTDGTSEYLDEVGCKVKNAVIVHTGKNLGFSGGNNVGISMASGDFIVLLNNDTYVTSGWVRDLVRPMIRDNTIGMTGPLTNNIGNEQKIKIGYRNMEEMSVAASDFIRQRKRKIFYTYNLAFFCVAIRREVISEVGLLDDQYERGFFEDDDYCRRVVSAGFKLVIVDDVFVHHHLSASFDQLGIEEKQRLMKVNMERYEAKWGKWVPHKYRNEIGFGE